MTDAKTFWDQVARKYAANPIKNIDAYRQTMNRVRAYLSNSDRVLEIGCGTGSTALLLAPHAGHVTASDISSEMIAIGKEKATAGKVENVEFVRAAPDDAFPTAPFDAVMTFNFLHLAADVPATLRRLNELAKPGGLLISKTPCLGSRRFILKPLLFVAQALGKAPGVTFFTPHQLDAMVADAGFEIVETGFYPAQSRFIVARTR